MKKLLTTFAIGSALVLVATGCSVGTESTGSGSETTQASTAAAASDSSTPAPAAPAPSSSAPAAPAPSSSSSTTEVEESLADFGQTWDYENGISVTVTHEGTAQASMSAAGAKETSGQMHLFKITIMNGTDAIFDPVGAYTTVNYGDAGEVAERVIDSAQGYADMWQGKILPGKKQSLTMAFAVPTDKPYEVLMSIAPGFDYKDSLFHGTLGK